jgi:hypothetical protein
MTINGIRMKALLFVLLRTFEFELAVEPRLIQGQSASSMVMRPIVANELHKGIQLPVIIKLCQAST